MSSVALVFEFIETINLVVGYLAEAPCQPSLRIDALNRGGFDEEKIGSHTFSATF
ncbi:hypothetical protein AB1E33_27460 [Ruegeria sp. 2012CJ15-1]